MLEACPSAEWRESWHAPPLAGSALAAAAAASAVAAGLIASHSRQSTWRPCFCNDSTAKASELPCAPSTARYDKHSALLCAVRAGDMNRALQLMAHLKDINEPLTATNETLLGVACAAGLTGLVDEFIRLGADPRAMDVDGSTCLAVACAEGWSNVVDRLMNDPRVDAAQADAYGLAPVHKAAGAGHEDTLHILLNYGADPSLATADDAKETPLHIVVKTVGLRQSRERQRRCDVLLMLLRFNAQVLCRDGEGDTPLHIAARRGDIWSLWQMLGFLSDASKAGDITNSDGTTLLAEARGWGPDAVMTVWAAVLFNPLRQWWDRNWVVASFARNVALTILVGLFFMRRYRAAGSPAT